MNRRNKRLEKALMTRFDHLQMTFGQLGDEFNRAEWDVIISKSGYLSWEVTWLLRQMQSHAIAMKVISAGEEGGGGHADA